LSSPPPVIVNAGSDDSLCHYDGINLSGTIVSLVDSIAWEQISGPSALTFADINDVNTAVSGFVGGLYELVLYGYNDNCPGHSDTVIITSFEPQINELSASNVSCFNFADGEVNVAGSNGLIPYLYSVNGGAYTPMTNYPSLDTGMYEFVMQDNFGCLDTLVSIITEPDSIAIAFARTDVSCFGFTDGAIDATISGGMPTYNFSWSNGQTTQNSTALGAGWHILTVIDDNGCTAVDSIEILAPPPLNLTATIDSVICNGNLDGNIDVLVTGGTVNYSYAWTGGIVTEDLIGYPAGTYDLVVTDDNGCVISASYEIFEPDTINYSVSINHESCENLCDGEIDLTSISGGTGSYSIILNGTNQFGNQLFSDLCSGNYTLEVKDENGCSLSSIEVINPGLSYADANFSVASILCAYDTTVTIVAIDPSGTWTANGIPSTLDINPANWGPGIYDIEHIIPGICPDTSNQTITINEIPVPNIWADQLIICNPDVVTLNNIGASGVNCLWDISGWTSSNCGPITFGTSQDGYFDVNLTVTNANGCTASQSIIDYLYFSNAPIANFYTDPDSIVSYYEPRIDFVNTSLNAVSYEWFINGSTHSTNENASYTNSTGLPGSYAVTLVAMNEYGCTDTITTTINYQDEPVLYVPNAFTPDGSSLNNTFFPVGNGVQITEWIIFDRWGEIVFRSHNIDSEWDGTYNGVLVQDGIYTWKITYLSENSGTPVTLVGHVNVLK
jgi:gliding motility-associated-like protein